MGNMNISRENYEVYVIDYLDGKLDPVRVAELMIFLQENPDLDDEVTGLGSIALEPEQRQSYDFKDLLSIPGDTDANRLSETNYTYYFTAAHEGDLSTAGMAAVETFLQDHPQLRNEYGLFALARLSPDDRIVFPAGKELIKTPPWHISRLYYTGAAAAVILLLFTVYFRLQPPPRETIADRLGGREIVTKSQDLADQNPIQRTDNDSASTKTRPVPLNPPAVKNGKEKTTPVKPNQEQQKKDNNTPTGEEQEEIRLTPRSQQQIMNITPEPFKGEYRSFYSDLFDDIERSQESFLASLEPVPASADPLPKSGAGQRFGNLLRSGAQLATQIPSSLSGWMIADAGIEGINLLTDNDLKLQRVANPDGRTRKVILTYGDKMYSLAKRPN